MSRKWFSTSVPGIRYREHPTRKHGKKPDRYFMIRYRKDRKSCQESLGWASTDGITQAIAIERLSEIKRNIRKGEGPQSLSEKRAMEKARREAVEAAQREAATNNITFADVWPKYLELAKSTKTAKSVTTERISIEKWALPSIGKKRLSGICLLDLERIKKKMLDAGRAPRTIEYLMAMIRQIFNYAIDHSFFNGPNPAKKVKRIKYDNKRLRFLSVDEADHLLNLLKSRNIDLHDMSLFSLHTGARAGEIFSLEWTDVDTDTGQITFRDTKNADSRHVYMSDAIKTMLEGRQRTAAVEQTPFVFPGHNGRKISDISRTFDRIVEESGLNDGITDRRQKFTFHSLRHSAASWLVQAGTPLYTVQRLLGHKTAALTERYSHLAPANLRAVTTVFNDATGKQNADVIPMTDKK
ncbi:MAG: site-specific integrase [Desulfobacteraceae bacterium]|nr:site-specific integrase [Desulfobacteraceae bacterium]MBC2756702.1 site-specific integrase [Desulfobacteraceae bacterium]